MFDLFLDIFAYKENAWTKMDSRAKLIMALTSILCILLSTRVILPLAIFALCLTALLLLRVPGRLVVARLACPMGIVIVLIVLQSFTFGSTIWFTLSFRIGDLSVMKEGVLKGVLIGSKVLGAVSLMLLLSAVTPAHKIFHSLRWMRIPQGWVEIAMLMYRYTFVFLDDVSDVAVAQKARLGYRGLRRSIASVGILAGAVIIRSLDQAVNTHEAMTLRGYNGSIPFSPMPSMGARYWWLTALICVTVFSGYFFLEWRPF